MIYPASSAVVVYTKSKHRQRHFMDHKHEGVSFAIHPNGNIVATGEVGEKPSVLLWNTRTLKQIQAMSTVMKGAVSLLSFSPDGKRLACVADDTFHCLIVYDWEAGKILFKDQIGRQKVFDCQFIDGSRIFTCGLNNVNFWIGGNEKNIYNKKPGLFGYQFKRQTMMCACPVPSVAGKIISGSILGEVYVWDGRKVCATLQAHDGPVNTCYASGVGVLTGGNDSRVILWSAEMENLATFDLKSVVSKSMSATSIRSACFSGDGTRILVSISAGEAYEISVADGSDVNNRPIISGHYCGEVNGLAPHPQRSEFATLGDDGVVRIFDIELFKCIRQSNLKQGGRAIVYSPEGTKIAVGIGTPDEANDADGSFKILNESTLQVIYQGKDANGWITHIQWSPDGDTLAVASADGCIYLYNNDDYATKGKAGGRAACVTRLDFSDDSQWLRSVCTDYTLLYHNAATGELNEAGPSELKSVDWASQCVTVGWHVCGIWPDDDDGVNVNACCLSSGICSNESPSLAVVDSVGKLRLYNYPVPGCRDNNILGKNGQRKQTAMCIELRAHSRGIGNVCFTLGDKEVITVGAKDRCILQWAHELDDMEETADVKEEEPEMFEEIVPRFHVDRSVELRNENVVAMDLMGDLSQESNLEFLRDQPWYNIIVPPSDPGETSMQAPCVDISLKWVYGFRAHDTRRTAVYAKGNELAYVASNILILYNQGEHKQRHGRAHPTDIVALAVAPDGEKVATGDVGDRPRILLWDIKSMSKIRTSQGLHRNAIASLDFSPDGSMLLSMGQDAAHTIGIWDVMSGNLRAYTRGGNVGVFDLKFTPDSQSFCSVGFQHIKFHEITGRNIVTRKGVIGHEKHAELQTFFCVGYAGNNAIAGTSDGCLYRFDGRQLESVIREAHDGVVNTIYTGEDRVVTGGYDGKVKVWSSPDLDVIGEFDVVHRGI